MKCINRSIILLANAALLLHASTECALISGARIRAEDLAPLAPAFAALPPAQDLGPAPFGTMIRVFSRAQLAALLPGLTAELPASVCVQRKRGPIPPAAWQSAVDDAMAKICPGTPWRAKILEVPNHLYPDGALAFTRSGLAASRGRENLWRGSLVLPGNATIPVWVRVDVESRRNALILLRALAPGELLTANDFREADIWAPGLCSLAPAINQVDGMAAKHALSAGSELRPEHLRRPPAISRGQSVELEVAACVARLRLPAVAARDADIGETVEFKSGWTGTKLIGRVTGAKTAKVE